MQGVCLVSTLYVEQHTQNTEHECALTAAELSQFSMLPVQLTQRK